MRFRFVSPRLCVCVALMGGLWSCQPSRGRAEEASDVRPLTLEDSVYAATADLAPEEQLFALFDTLEARGQNPEWAGWLFDSENDPEARRAVTYVLREDTTVWVRSWDGASVVLDAHVAAKLGRVVSEETAFGDRPPEQGLGYGLSGGRLYLYASQGVEYEWAIVLAVLGLGGIGAAIAQLVRALRRSQERERVGTEARRRLVEAREGERLRIAREIHDGPVQDLHAVRLRMGAESEGPLGSGVLGVIHGLRAISEGLRPPALASMGFEAAVGSLVGRYEESYPEIAVSLDVEGEAMPVSENVGLALFRVVQEAMNNAAQHASPASVRVSLRYAASGVLVRVDDDGQGFEAPEAYEALGADGHYGLLGMTERAASVGGTMSIRHRPEGGTRVEVVVPQGADPVQTD